MTQTKLVTITTGLFELTIFWNGIYVSIQSTIFLGLFAILFFSTEPATKRMCIVFLVIDLIVVLFLLLNHASVTVEDYVPKKSENKVSSVRKESIDISTDTSSATDHSSVTEVSGEIKNKVAMPNQQSPKESAHKDPTEAVQNNIDAISDSMKPVDDMDETDWDSLFGDMEV